MLAPISSNIFSIPSPPITPFFFSSSSSTKLSNHCLSDSSNERAFFGEGLGLVAGGGEEGSGEMGAVAARAAFDLTLGVALTLGGAVWTKAER